MIARGRAGPRQKGRKGNTHTLISSFCLISLAALHASQVEEYGATKAIASHCETRFSIVLKIASDLKGSKSALRALVEDKVGFDGLKTKHVDAHLLGRLAVADWWAKLEKLINTMQPISDAIHQLEGDRPMLSQVLPVWNGLIEHLRPPTSPPPSLRMLEPVAAAERRFKKHYHPCIAAAYVLDPINFVETGLNFEGLTDLQIGDVIHMAHRLNGPYKDYKESEDARYGQDSGVIGKIFAFSP